MMQAVFCDIRDTIQTFIADHFLFGDLGNLKTSDSLLESGVLDSMGVLELVDFVERQFGVKIPAMDMVPANLDGIERLATYVKSRT